MNKTANRARHALPLLHILILLFIGGIGVHTLTSCSDSKDDDDPPSDTSSSSLDDGNSSSSGGGGGGSSSSGGGSGSSSSTGGSGTIEAVRIGDLTWMKRNLDTNVLGSKCYDGDPANCVKYGRLYDWATAMKLDPSCNSKSCSGEILPKHQGICPAGWRIPSNADWDALFRWVDEENDGEGDGSPYGSYTAGRYLKASSGWYDDGNGTDKYDFSALPGGYGRSDGYFGLAGRYGIWWSSTENEDYGYAYSRDMGYSNEDASWDVIVESILFSVRCVQD